MTQSSWELTKQRSKYHFDTTKWNPKWDRVERLGVIEANWAEELQQVLDQAKPVTWRTRGQATDPLKRQSIEYDQEEYDLEQQGYDKNYVVTDLTYSLPAVFQDLANKFCLEKCMARIHVQRPGQVWNLHLDKLEKWMPEDSTQVVRYFVQLTDWQQGHFWSFGNYMWSGWQAGEVVTLDWLNVPHSTANAGHTPRVTLQVTGIKTAKTQEFLDSLS